MTAALRRLLAAATLMGVLCGCDDGAPKPVPEKAAAAAPAPAASAEPRLAGLALRRLDGGTDPIESFRGKVVVLNIWATWCGPCRREMPGLDRLARSLEPDRFAVLGLSIDENPAVVREYLRQQGIRFAGHFDPRGDLTHQVIDVSAVPKTVVISADGRIVWQAVGERVWDEPGVAAWLRGLI